MSVGNLNSLNALSTRTPRPRAPLYCRPPTSVRGDSRWSRRHSLSKPVDTNATDIQWQGPTPEEKSCNSVSVAVEKTHIRGNNSR